MAITKKYIDALKSTYLETDTDNHTCTLKTNAIKEIYLNENVYFSFAYINLDTQSFINITTQLNWDKVKNMNHTFSGCSNVVSTPFYGPNVRNIDYTYQYCSNLIGSPVCGPYVTSMDGTYEGCSNITGSPVCGPYVTTMAGTYEGCSNITGNAVCGPLVTNMTGAYDGCGNIEKAICGDNVVYMNSAFRNCYKITEAVVGPNVKHMAGAYEGCNQITEAIVGQNVIVMNNAYKNCTNIINAVVGPNVKYMTSAYEGCSNLTKAVKGLNMTCTYANCEKLVYPNGIGVGTYSNCPNLLYSSPDYATNISYLYSNCINLTDALTYGEYMNYAYRNCSKITQTPFIRETRELRETFLNCTNLTTINSSGIGNNCWNLIETFSGCTNLIDPPYFHYNASPLSMYGTFYECTNLSSVNIPKNIGWSMSYTFYNCRNITSAKFPESSYGIELQGTYQNCINLIESENINVGFVNMNDCFKGDYQLSGNITIFNPNPSIIKNVTNAFDLSFEDKIRTNYLNVFIPKNTSLWDQIPSLTPAPIIELDDNTFYCEEQKIYFKAFVKEKEIIEEKEPTCTENGYIKWRYVDEYEENEDIIPALGHDYDPDTHICKRCGVKETDMEGIEITSNGDYFFMDAGEDKWISNNSFVDDSYATTTFHVTGHSSLEWSVSSESEYDYLTITVNGNEEVYESGENDGTIYLTGDDIIIAEYSKDGSSEGGDDRAVIKFIK